MAKKNIPWSIDEVATFLQLIADDTIQRELDGTTRNLKVFQEVSALLSERGFSRTFQQCREKRKKLKSEYRAVKDHNGRSGSDRKSWKWFDLLDAIYGHRPANVGREGGLDSATVLLESLHDDAIGTSEEEQSQTTGGGSVPSSTSSEHTSTRPQTPVEEPTPTPSAITTPQRVVLGKRKRGGDELLAQQARHHEQNLAQVDRHWQLTMEAAARAREEEMALRREENAQTHAFNLAFLRTLGQVLGGSRRGPSPQEDEPPL
ncbi:zinc finger and SCAN domain-containing protein 20-like [Gymnodraco acuticeps]|uniref:Zinc finger and SCAN domain-containing protein 20-like n=1 Tax=Gymnodraco acuticeps TaxID=8218 RepID=A0A6P8UBX7_GYMAC|nr:zinc finger and SCAN domain-containing protein 20-like [Gymnodraco acuticeps]